MLPYDTIIQIPYFSDKWLSNKTVIFTGQYQERTSPGYESFGACQPESCSLQRRESYQGKPEGALFLLKA